MEFKLFNLLLAEADGGIDKKRHVYNTEDEHGNVYPHRHVQFDRYNTFDQSLDVYGDKSVVIKYKVNGMKWYNHKEQETFDHGINTMDIEEILLFGKPVFTAKGDLLPNMDMTKWDGSTETVTDLNNGIQAVMDEYRSNGNKEAIDAYINALKAKPSLWHDIAKALLDKYHELDSEAPSNH